MISTFNPWAPFDRLVLRYLGWKARWSRAIAGRYQTERKSIPAFDSVEELEMYRRDRFRYRNDPMFGLLDYYQHPEHLMVTQAGDCDCQAVWVYKALQSMFDHRAEIVTIVSPVVWKNHVFCAVTRPDGRLCSIDTRGLHEHRDQADMIDFYNRAFKTRFRAYPTSYPFE